MSQSSFLNVAHIYRSARQSDDGHRCMVAPHPDLQQKMRNELAALAESTDSVVSRMVRISEPSLPGLNDGTIIPPEDFPLGTPPSTIRMAAAARAPLRGTVRVIVVLVDFADQPANPAYTKPHFEKLFFSVGQAEKSVRDYYREVTNGLIDIQGEVVGPFRMPRNLTDYANGASGLGSALPNAATMARDAALAADPSVNFTPYDNDGNGFVDAFVIIHSGAGAEETANKNQIWSHKWVLDGGALAVDSTKIYGYLTVPESARIGVCCHELGHLLFGFPDLYDTDGSSEGIGNWCLMAAGSWGGTPPGSLPVHPSAWCKASQGWVAVDNRTSNANLSIADVKQSHTVHRLWKNGVANPEYFLLENRQQSLFDASLPGSGLLLWHIDESVSGNTNESHYKVALMQADGRKDLEQAANRGDGGDVYPGTTGNHRFDNSSTPNSKSYNGLATSVSVTNISSPGTIMTARVSVTAGIPTSTLQSGATSEGVALEHIEHRLGAIEVAIDKLGELARSESRNPQQLSGKDQSNETISLPPIRRLARQIAGDGALQ